jgi:hypothetical protein
VWSIRIGAPTHFMRDVKQFCDCHYPEEWVGRNVLVLWPPRSPDLTPVGTSRDTVYWQTVTKERVWRLFEAAVTRIFLKLSRVPGISDVTGLSCANLIKFCKTFVDIKTMLCWNVDCDINMSS